MRTRLFLLGLMLAAASGLAEAKRAPIDYTAYAGEPIPEFKFSQLYNWQRVNDRQLVVWTKPSTAYLLSLRNPCHDLSGRVVVQIGGVDGIPGRLQAGFGDVMVGQMRCPVDTIQPIDLARIKAERA